MTPLGSRCIAATLLAVAPTVLAVWSGAADDAHPTRIISLPTPKALWQVLGDEPTPWVDHSGRMTTLRERIYWPLYGPQVLLTCLATGAYLTWAFRRERRRRAEAAP